jgi:hypothetical protein
VAIGRTVYRWNGLSYATLPTAGLSMPITRLWVSPSGTVYALGADCTYSDQSVSVYDGISKWTDLYYNSPSFTYCSTSNENLAGTADDNVWFGDMWKGGHAVVPQNTTLLGYLMAPIGPGVGFTANATTVWQRTNGQQIPRFSAGAPPKCTQASTDAAGLTWLSCAGALGRVGSNGFSQTSTTTALKAVYAAPSGSVWLALQSGTIERRSGATTTPYTQYAGSTFTAIHGTSDSNVFVLTTEGGVARFDGSAWTPSMIPAGTNPQMQGIVAVSATSAWAWRSAGVYEYASGTWSSVALPGGVTSVSSMAAGGGGVWLLGSTSSSSTPLLYLRSGSTWTLQRTFTQGGVVLASASSGALTLAGTVLERWVSGTGASTVATIANASAYPQFIAMPAVNEVVFGWDDNVYRYKW